MPTAIRVVDQFIELSDTPASFSGQGSKFVAVNSGATALEFVAAPSGGTPGGSTTQVQYNNAGAFGGAAGFVYQAAASPNVSITAQNAAYTPLLVKGAASQSANLQEWQDSTGVRVVSIDKDGGMALGINTTVVNRGRLWCHGTPYSYGALRSLTEFIDTSALAANTGCDFGFGATYTGSSRTIFAAIGGRKSNATANNWDGHLVFITRTNADGSYYERMRIDANGKVGIGLTPTANMVGLSIEAGVMTIKETTTPTADADYGKIYCKNDNKLYFQDGAGTEHEIAFV